MTTIPLGKQESQELEFKRAEALDRPQRIAREVAAMLNAGKGQIWIGIEETNGFATRVQGIPNAAARRVSLLNSLIGLIDPPIKGEEVGLNVVADDAGRDLLLLEISGESQRRPYAVMKEGGRHYQVRVDHRLRPMSHDEIFRRGPQSPKVTAESILGGRRRQFIERHEDCFWIGLQPTNPVKIKVQDPKLLELLEQPELSGNRRSGWNFRTPGARPQLEINSLVRGEHGARRIEVHADGGIELSMPLSWLAHGRFPGEETREIYPLALLEYVISIPRLAKGIAERLALPGTGVLLDVALLGAEDWHIPAYPPNTYGYTAPPPWEDPGKLRGEDLLFAAPQQVPENELLKFPDQVGFKMVRAIYQAFGLAEDRMPKEYSKTLGQLDLHD